MTVTVLCIGDPHFVPTKHPKIYDQMQARICDLIRDNDFDFVVVLGDVFHYHDVVHVQTLTRVQGFFDAILDALGDKPLYVLVGNHDMINNQQFMGKQHALQTMHGRDRLHIVESTTTLDLDGHTFGFVPYVPNGRFGEALRYADVTKCDYTCIFAHQEFKGARLGPMVSKHGDEWAKTDPLVISGHVHDAHSPQPNIIYVGTPVQHSFGEDANKAVGVFTFDGDDFEYARVPLKLAKHYTHNLTLQGSNPSEFVKGVIKKRKETDDDTHRIVVKGTLAEIQAFQKNKMIMKKLANEGIKVKFKNTDHSTVEDEPDTSHVIQAADRNAFIGRLKQKCEESKMSIQLSSLLNEVIA